MIIELLNMIKKEIESCVPIPDEYTVSRGNKNGFEELVPLVLEKIKKQNGLDFHYDIHLGHHFPDIDILISGVKYGIELKSRNNSEWSTNGNSVFESITGENYEEIYILFGSLNQKKQRFMIRHAPYWSVTSDIKVTHSPRFLINMNTADSVFEDSSDYIVLRNSSEDEKISFLQNYLKDNAKGDKWYTSDSKKAINPIQLKDVDKKISNRVLIESVILYPQDFFMSKDNYTQIKSDYSRASEYIISNYFYYSTGFRDHFSAGGQWEYQANHYPKFFKKLHENRNLINHILISATEDFKNDCLRSWEEVNITPVSCFSEYFYAVIDDLGRKNFPNHIVNLRDSKLSSLIRP